MLTNNWIFYIRTFKLLCLGRETLRWNYNLTLTQVIVNDGIPHTYLREYIFIIDLGIICHGQTQLNETHLIFHAVDKFNVLNVVFNKLLPVICIELFERISWILFLLITQLLLSDVVKTIRLLLGVSKLLVELQIV